MSYDFTDFKKRSEEVKSWLLGEFASIHTGRATPALIEKVQVSSYGATQPLKQVAGVSIEDAKTLRISPWDKNLIGEIQSAIDKANLGISCSSDDTGLRIKFPDMTGENRKNITKIVKEKLETAKISLRKERENVWSDIQAKEKSSLISEDDKFRLKDELQDIINEYNKEFEALSNKKEKDILGLT